MQWIYFSLARFAFLVTWFFLQLWYHFPGFVLMVASSVVLHSNIFELGVFKSCAQIMPCVSKNALQYYGFTDWQMQNFHVTDWLNSNLTNDHSANLPFSCSHGHEMGKKLVLKQSIATFFLECIAILWLFLV